MKGTPQDCFPSPQLLLTWSQFNVSDGAPTTRGDFRFGNATPVYEANGSAHGQYKTFGHRRNELLFRSTGVLCGLEHRTKMLFTFPVPFRSTDDYGAPEWPHTHTLDVRV